MSDEYDAIYEHGVFRPLEPVSLPDQTRVHLHVRAEPASDSTDTSIDEVMQQRAALQELMDWLRKLPTVAEDQGVSARDHDEILYGWKK
jgi:predicted DNA-binding antitoxin AbrB/MazE fold protein